MTDPTVRLLAKWERHEELTREERIALAVSRYGRVEPSPDDVLGRAWPRYNEHPAHTTGWHADELAVMRVIDAEALARGEGVCKVCGDPLPPASGTGTANRRYCGPDCAKAVAREAAKTRSQRCTPLDEAERTTCVDLYVKGGYSIEAVALEVGRSKMAVVAALDEAGIARRGSRPKGSDSMSMSLGQVA